MPDENIFLSRNEAAARQLRSTSPPTTTTKIPNLSTYCSTLSPSAGTRTSPPATRTRRNGPYPNIKGSSSIPNTPVSNTPLCRMQFCEWGIPFLLIDDLVFSALTLWKQPRVQDPIDTHSTKWTLEVGSGWSGDVDGSIASTSIRVNDSNFDSAPFDKKKTCFTLLSLLLSRHQVP